MVSSIIKLEFRQSLLSKTIWSLAVRRTSLVALLSVCFIAGAPNCPAQTTPTVETPRASALPSSAPQSVNTLPAAGVSAPSGYQLGANDQVAVEVFGEDDLRTAARLNSEGAVSLPLLGTVRLAGLTLPQAAAKLTELYGRDYLVNPKVNVSLINYAKRRFTVLGQVNRPGSYEMPEGSPEGIDILEAIAFAGGYTRIAAPERISVRRHGANGDQIIKVNAKRLAKGQEGPGGSFRVQPGDTINVGESWF
jgi:polysaccharide export outer membrane protein